MTNNQYPTSEIGKEFIISAPIQDSRLKIPARTERTNNYNIKT
jgi:hypothetical protein